MVEAGTVLGGKYRLRAPLGEGGMGAVWIADNLAIKGAEVAVKVLHAHFARETETVQRFRQEAEAAVCIGHPNIVKVFDFGSSPDGAPYLVMERMVGESLAARLEREGALAPEEAVDIVVEVLRALEAAHDKDILHRDMKPENIFLAQAGELIMPKILDFGVSKILGDDAERVRMTRTGALVGTPAYMSPEQALGDATVDLRSDVWAMGVILYELLSGHLPYEGTNYNAVLIRIATGDSTPLAAVAPHLPPGLVAIVARAMARERGQRFGSVGAMREALERWRRGDDPGVSLPPPQPTPSPRASAPHMHADTMLATPAPTVAPASKPSRVPVLLASVAALTVALVMGVALRRPAAQPALQAEASASMRAATAAGGHALRIDNLPPRAHIAVDDAPVMLPTRLAADGDHRVRVEAPGYRPWMAVVSRPSADVVLRYAGEPEAPTLPTTAEAPTVLPPHAIVPARPPVARGVAGPRRGRRPATGSVNDLLATNPGI
jgi:serine/threonine protein kinase